MTIEAGEDASVRARFERDLSDQPGGNCGRRSRRDLGFFRERANQTLRCGVETA